MTATYIGSLLMLEHGIVRPMTMGEMYLDLTEGLPMDGHANLKLPPVNPRLVCCRWTGLACMCNACLKRGDVPRRRPRDFAYEEMG